MRRRAALALALAAAGIAAAAASGTVRAAAAHPCLVVTGAGDSPFVRNFNPFANPDDFTWGGIYEPLVVVTQAGGGHEYLWLASALTWSGDGKTLTITVRHGVRWSDGRPLTARDVLYTLTAGRRIKAMDQIGLRRPGNEVTSITLAGPGRVAVHLARRDSTFVPAILANNLSVVPEHVFAHVRHLTSWTNPNPVGTGPFTIVKHFDNESYELDRNPHYWLPGAPHVPCIVRVLASSTDSALVQMRRGEIDLTNDFIPNAAHTYVSHDPVHFHYFYATTSEPVGLFFDDQTYPYSLAPLRQAISMAIDRRALSDYAEFGYAPPVDAIGIDRNWPGWTDPSVAAEARRLATYDPAAARETLRRAGFTYRGSTLLDPTNRPVVMHATVIASWTDWVACWRIIASDLQAVGITVKVDAVPAFGDWQPAAFATRTATLLWNNLGNGPSPYDYFDEHLAHEAYVPPGHDAELTGDWEHFWNPEATHLLAAFRSTFDPKAQHLLAARLERVWLRTMPYVPLFAGPTWSTYSTQYFTGFPSARDYYVQPAIENTDYVVALTRIRPAR